MCENLIVLSAIKPGMVGLSSGSDWIQDAIKFFTKGDTHSFVVIRGAYEDVAALETSSTIIKESPFARKLDEPDTVSMWDVIAAQEDKDAAGKATYEKYIGKWYGYLSYLWFMYRWAVRQLGYEPKKMWGWASKGTICSELVCHYIYGINDDFKALFNGRDINTITPFELKQIFLNNPKMFRFVGYLDRS